MSADLSGGVGINGSDLEMTFVSSSRGWGAKGDKNAARNKVGIV